MSYWPLCKTYLLFPQNPSRRFLREGTPAECISGTYLPHALLHPRGHPFGAHPYLRQPNRGSQTIPVVSLCAADAGECPVVLLDGNAIHALRLERGTEDDAVGIQLRQV